MVTRDGPRLFLYAATDAEARDAERSWYETSSRADELTATIAGDPLAPESERPGRTRRVPLPGAHAERGSERSTRRARLPRRIEAERRAVYDWQRRRRIFAGHERRVEARRSDSLGEASAASRRRWRYVARRRADRGACGQSSPIACAPSVGRRIADVRIEASTSPTSPVAAVSTSSSFRSDVCARWRPLAMSWPRDDAKLERVRALMAERELDALVVRAPDNVLYLTNFWGMKGYDACVFPREGEPVLICLEASEEDAARTAWTSDVRLFKGYDPGDPRPPTSRVLELAREAAARVRARRSRALARHAGLGPHGRRADDVHRDWFDALRRRRRRDAAPRRGARDQDRAGDRAHAARERHRRRRDGALQAGHRAGHDRGADRRRVAGLRPRRGHRLGGQGRPRARLLARLVGAGDQDVHRDDVAPGRRGRADALRDLGLRRRLLVRPHEEPRRAAS